MTPRHLLLAVLLAGCDEDSQPGPVPPDAGRDTGSRPGLDDAGESPAEDGAPKENPDLVWERYAGGFVYSNHPSEPEGSFMGDPTLAVRDGVLYLFAASFIHAWNPVLLPHGIPDSIPWGPCELQWGTGRCSVPIGMATSEDGIVWTRFDRGTDDLQDDYVMVRDGPSSWDAGSIEAPTALWDESDGKFKIWYNGLADLADEGERLLSQKIGYAESVDGIEWVKYDDPGTTEPLYAMSDPVIAPRDGMWDALATPDPTVLLEEGVFRMWYGGIGADGNLAIGYAQSADGITWERTDEPVLEDDGFATGAEVFRVGARYEMFYYTRSSGIFRATSIDGIDWQKRGQVLAPGSSGSWDDLETSAPAVRRVGDRYHLYYTGSSCPIDGTGPEGCAIHIKLGLAFGVVEDGAG